MNVEKTSDLQTITKSNNTIIDYGYTIYNGDSLSIMGELIDKGIHVNMIFTSPPYNMQLSVHNNKYISRANVQQYTGFEHKYEDFNDDLPLEDYFKFHSSCIDKMLEISDIILYNIQIVSGSKESTFKIIGKYAEYIKDIIIWDKGHGAPAICNGILNKATELIIVFQSDGTKGRKIKYAQFDRGTESDIWRFPRELSIYNKHRAVFPLKLAEHAIKNFSRAGDTILDPFMGTGTTGVASINLNRKFIGIDISSKYCDVSKKRIDEAVEKYKMRRDISDVW